MNSSEVHGEKPTRRLARETALKNEFESVALCHLPAIYTAACYLTKNSSEAEDLVQETYLRAFRFFEKFEPDTNCRAWLMSILRRLFINDYRKREREPQTVGWDEIDTVYESVVGEQETVGTSDPETLLISNLLDDEVDIALQALPEEFRMAVVGVDIADLSYEEAAKVLECPIGTVRSRVSRGRRILQVTLREYALKRAAVHRLMKSSSSERMTSSQSEHQNRQAV